MKNPNKEEEGFKVNEVSEVIKEDKPFKLSRKFSVIFLIIGFILLISILVIMLIYINGEGAKCLANPMAYAINTTKFTP